MNKFSRIAIAALSSAALFSTFATPASALTVGGKITFNGNVTDTTCDVVGGAGTGGETENITVQLPSVPKGDLAAAGDIAGSTPFKLLFGNQSGCTKTAISSLKFTQDSVNVDGIHAGTLNNVLIGGAGNVNVQIGTITGATYGVINQANVLNLTTNTTAIAPNVSSATGEDDYWFFAQYYATAAATAGGVQSNVQYVVTYN